MLIEYSEVSVFIMLFNYPLYNFQVNITGQITWIHLQYMLMILQYIVFVKCQ